MREGWAALCDIARFHFGCLSAALTELVAPPDDEPQSPADQVAARTAWLRDHIPPERR